MLDFGIKTVSIRTLCFAEETFSSLSSLLRCLYFSLIKVACSCTQKPCHSKSYLVYKCDIRGYHKSSISERFPSLDLGFVLLPSTIAPAIARNRLAPVLVF